MGQLDQARQPGAGGGELHGDVRGPDLCRQGRGRSGKSVGGGFRRAAAGSWQLSNLGPKMVEGDYRPGFMVKLLQKDLRLALEESDSCTCRSWARASVHQLLRKAEDAGWGDEGTQALVKVVEELASTRCGKRRLFVAFEFDQPRLSPAS